MSDISVTPEDTEILTRVEGERRLRFWEENPPETGFVYLIQGEHRTPVKVGYAKEPRKRLSQLQTGSYTQLHVLDLVPGSQSVERDLHKRLAPHSVRGEWFKWRDAIATWLAFRSVAEAAMTFYRATGRVPKLEVFDAWHSLIETTRPTYPQRLPGDEGDYNFVPTVQARERRTMLSPNPSQRWVQR